MANLPEFRVYLEKPPAGWDALAESFKEKIRYDDAGKKLVLTGRLSKNDKKTLRDLTPQDEAYQGALEYLLLKSELPQSRVPLEKLPADWNTLPDVLRNKMLYDGEKLVLMGYLTESERSDLLGLSKETDYQDAIEYLFWKSNSPPDTLKRKEPDDKDFVTEKLTRMKPWVHRALAVWLVIIGIGSVIAIIGIWPHLKENVSANKDCPVHWLYKTSDQVLFILAFLAGIIGSATHGISSLMDFRGNRRLFRSWSLWYFALPIVGGMVAIVFYITVRAGFIAGNGGTETINPFGIASVSVMVGLFTDKATTKLAEVFDTMFKVTTKPREGALDNSAAKEKPIK